MPPIPAHWLPEDREVSQRPNWDIYIPFRPKAPMQIRKTSSLPPLLALWFSHAGLLENCVNVPSKTATRLGMAVVRILRAEYGFPPETAGVIGMGKQRRPSRPSLIDIGLEMARSDQGELLDFADPPSLKAVLLRSGNHQGTVFPYEILSLAQRPAEHQSLLMGLARAFLDLEMSVPDSQTTVVLSLGSREALRMIINRKEIAFGQWLEEMNKNSVELGNFSRGYALGRMRLEAALED